MLPCVCATERVVWPPLPKPREPLSPLPRPSLCDLCLLPPVFVPECNKLKKDASAVSHSDPGPLPIWSLKCSHGLPRSGGSSGGKKCPPPCPVASRPAASTASEWQGGHRRSGDERVPRRVGSAPYSPLPRRQRTMPQCRTTHRRGDIRRRRCARSGRHGAPPATSNCDVLPYPCPRTLIPPPPCGGPPQLPLRAGGLAVEAAVVAAAVPGVEASRLLRLSVVP